MRNVYISYAAQDRDIAQRVQDTFNRAGIQGWKHDNGLKAGETWLDVISKAVSEADAGLFLLSPASASSAWAKREYQAFLTEGKPLYVARVQPVSSEDVPYPLRSIQSVDLTTDYEQNIGELVQAIRANETPETTQAENASRRSGDLTVTLEMDEDTDTQKVVDLISRLSEIGVRDIKVVNGGKR